MPVPTITISRFTAVDRDRPLLLLGPSLGTSAATLWGACAAALGTAFDVVAWDLPGHGRSAPATAGFSMAELAEGVLAATEPVLDERGAAGGGFRYAGDSIGGAVGLQLLLDHPDRIHAATLVCTGARIGEPRAWHERAELVTAGGTAAAVALSRSRWFGPGFAEREPAVAEALLDELRATDPADYARACHALAAFDVRERLPEITAPVLAVAGDADLPTPVEGLRAIAETVANGRLVVLAGIAHLAPAEAPEQVAHLITGAHLTA